MSEIKLTLDISNTTDCTDLGIELWLDQNKFFDETIAPGVRNVQHVFDEDDDSHQFKIVLKNKQINHTEVDENGNILKDVIIDVSNICFDDINVDTIVQDLAVYKHDHNGTSEFTSDKFFGHLGCNGTVTLEFTMPFYLWLLENMHG